MQVREVELREKARLEVRAYNDNDGRKRVVAVVDGVLFCCEERSLAAKGGRKEEQSYHIYRIYRIPDST